MRLDLAGYFDRVKYSGAAEPTLDVLQKLITAHTQSIPFENLDPLMHVPVDDLSPEALTDKLIYRRRGGFCFEHSGLMGYVLAELGFKVRRFTGRVFWMRPAGTALPSLTHTMLAVTFPRSQGSYLVDVGFGGQTPTSPIRLETGTVQQTTREPFRLVDCGDGLGLQARVRGEWQLIYEFTTQTRPEIDLRMGSWFASTHPSSLFVAEPMAVTMSDDARWNLVGRTLAVHRKGATEKTVLDDPAAVVDALRDRFGINIDDVGERSALEARIAVTCW